MVRSTHLLMKVTDGAGGTTAGGCTVAGFPAEIRLKVEMTMEDGTMEANWVTIPLKIVDAMGIPPIKRLFLPPSAEEMLEAQTKLGDLERRLEEDD